MRLLAEMMGRELYWWKDRLLGRSWELRAGDNVLATIDVRGLTGRSATIASAEGSWSISHAHLFSRRLLVSTTDGSPVAEYHPGFRTGELRFADGAEYPVTTGILPRSIRATNGAGSPLVTQTWLWPGLRRVARVEIEPAGTAEDRLGLVTGLALLILYYRRRAAAASSGG